MRVLKSVGLGGALLAAALTVAPVAATPASAMPLAAPLGAVAADSGAPVVNVQYYGHRHGGYRGGYRRGNNVGGAIAAGAAIGIIGGIIASQAQPRYYEPAPVYRAPAYGSPDDAYCFSKYKSYDPESGTYLGYDGYRHPCQ